MARRCSPNHRSRRSGAALRSQPPDGAAAGTLFPPPVRPARRSCRRARPLQARRLPSVGPRLERPLHRLDCRRSRYGGRCRRQSRRWKGRSRRGPTLGRQRAWSGRARRQDRRAGRHRTGGKKSRRRHHRLTDFGKAAPDHRLRWFGEHRRGHHFSIREEDIEDGVAVGSPALFADVGVVPVDLDDLAAALPPILLGPLGVLQAGDPVALIDILNAGKFIASIGLGGQRDILIVGPPAGRWNVCGDRLVECGIARHSAVPRFQAHSAARA